MTLHSCMAIMINKLNTAEFSTRKTVWSCDYGRSRTYRDLETWSLEIVIAKSAVWHTSTSKWKVKGAMANSIPISDDHCFESQEITKLSKMSDIPNYFKYVVYPAPSLLLQGPKWTRFWVSSASEIGFHHEDHDAVHPIGHLTEMEKPWTIE